MEPMRKSLLIYYKQDRLIEHFISGSTALTAASLCGVNRKTAAFFFLRLREIIVFELEAESEAMFSGEIEVDESYLGGKRKGKRGRGAGERIPVFGLLKRGGRVYTKIIPDASRASLPRSLSAKSCLTASSILTAGRPTMCWMFRTSSISELTTLYFLQIPTTTSTVSRISVTRQSVTCIHSTVSQRLNSANI